MTKKHFSLALKRGYILLYFVLATLSGIKAQTPLYKWVKQLKGGGSTIIRSISLDKNSNIYTGGFFEGTVDFDPGSGTYNLTSKGGMDIFISKMDSSGNFIWAKSMGRFGYDFLYAITLDNYGNVYSTGSFEDTVDFNPGIGIYNLPTDRGTALFISKLDASGNFVWAKQIGGKYDDSHAGKSIALDKAGSIYITGNFFDDADFDPGAGVYTLTAVGGADAFVCKLDSSGNFVWAKQMGGTYNDGGNDIAIDEECNVYTTGYFEDTVDFDPGVGIANYRAIAGRDIFISKLDSSGNFVWAKQVKSSSRDDSGNALTLDSLGNLYITGNYGGGTADFDPDTGTYSLTSVDETTFVWKLNASGNLIWVKQMEPSPNYIDCSNSGQSIAVDSEGNILTIGSFHGKVDFNPGIGVHSFYASDRNVHVFISKLDSSGNHLWAGEIGGIMESYGTAIVVDKQNNLYAAGLFKGTVNFNTGYLKNYLTADYEDGFVLKMFPCKNPSPPVNTTPIINLNICNNTSAILTASGEGTLGWYSKESNGAVYLGGGNSFTTPKLTGKTTYYVQDSFCFASQRTAIVVNVSLPNTRSQTLNICLGDSVVVGSSVYKTTGTYTNTFKAFNGCDSSITTNLTVNIPKSRSQNRTICFGDSVVVGNSTYKATGTYNNTFVATNGCDSMVVTNLTVNDPIDTSVSINLLTLTSNQTGASYRWLNCANNSHIQGAINQSFTPLESGQYSVVVIIKGCIDTSACVTMKKAGVGVAELVKSNNINIYPNPANDNVTIENTILIKNVTIMDISGKVVYEQNTNSNKIDIGTAELSNGIYMITIVDDRQPSQRKLMINR